MDRLQEFTFYNNRLILNKTKIGNKLKTFFKVQCLNCEEFSELCEQTILKSKIGVCLKCWGNHIGSLGLNKKPKNIFAEKYLYGEKRRKARDRDIEFKLSLNQFISLMYKNCFYCGVKNYNKRIIKTTARKLKWEYMGIDRINSNIGYIYENCVPCCAHCNRAKGSKTLKDFINWVNLVHNKFRS